MKRIIIRDNSDGEHEFLLEIGENQNENDILICKSDPNDYWFHLDKFSGPHFVLHTDNRKVGKRILNNIASLFCEYKRNLPNRYNVIYTEIKNIKLTSVPGTVIPRKTRLLRM